MTNQDHTTRDLTSEELEQIEGGSLARPSGPFGPTPTFPTIDVVER